ncbi:phosphate ABC transporter substrate-binding protein [Pedobacter ginsengisoli]|uniref:Phosphate ABC transporter substrate-binding protein n=1 Tax=Pedobacter ginsengisoli TaxID=363852 RepID=A0A2D1U925_9SPHI|nr:substrate-binding domain-containing protein [Pedobacter ginsengisoli]ATP58123.1 phosphate ABC transporter substrate-binding protein [Pedobacter ginsengisoli]
MRNLSFVFIFFVLLSCKNKKQPDVVEQTRTSGSVKILVDESFSSIIADQIMVFKSDYKHAEFTTIAGNENKILPAFLNDSVRVIILSRMLTPQEDKIYRNRSIVPKTSRFAIDGISLLTQKDDLDSNITVEEVVNILKGTSASGKQLVFDNAYSSTLRYFKELAQITELPKKGVYTLQSNNDVIKYVSEHKNFIGVVGVNWLLANNSNMTSYIAKVKMMGVRNIKGKKGDNAYYRPDQANLINGIYPFLRNIYIINCEGRDGLGTGFANWLLSPRGQLIVLKSGLGPHKMMSRDFNLKNTN